MRKSALVIETPDSCSKCKFSYEFEGIKKCHLLNMLQNGGKAIIPTDKYAESRHDNCPLVDIPHMDGLMAAATVKDCAYPVAYARGFNDLKGMLEKKAVSR